jgi:ABC-type multidrug transport system fused ATPase/permease subunit
VEHSLVLFYKDQCIFENDEHWLYPLFALEDFLKGKNFNQEELFLKDKIAGKAAASLMVKFGISNCYIELLSERAIPVFERNKVKYTYGTLVDHIQCRTEDLIIDSMTIDETYTFLRKRAGRVKGVQLKIDNLKVEYSGKSILNGLDLELSRGEQLIVQGDNGSGKTTLLKSILGLITPLDGTITIGDGNVGNLEWKRNRIQTGYLPQDSVKNNFPISAAEVVAIGLSIQS